MIYLDVQTLCTLTISFFTDLLILNKLCLLNLKSWCQICEKRMGDGCVLCKGQQKIAQPSFHAGTHAWWVNVCKDLNYEIIIMLSIWFIFMYKQSVSSQICFCILKLCLLNLKSWCQICEKRMGDGCVLCSTAVNSTPCPMFIGAGGGTKG